MYVLQQRYIFEIMLHIGLEYPVHATQCIPNEDFPYCYLSLCCHLVSQGTQVLGIQVQYRQRCVVLDVNFKFFVFCPLIRPRSAKEHSSSTRTSSSWACGAACLTAPAKSRSVMASLRCLWVKHIQVTLFFFLQLYGGQSLALSRSPFWGLLAMIIVSLLKDTSSDF